MKLSEPVRAIAFDADDTLWDLQSNFDAVEQDYCKLLSDFGTSDELSKQLFHTETANMPILGYGCKAFTISLVENALKVSKGTVSPATIGEIVRLGKSLLTLDFRPCRKWPQHCNCSTIASATNWWCSLRANCSTSRTSFAGLGYILCSITFPSSLKKTRMPTGNCVHPCNCLLPKW